MVELIVLSGFGIGKTKQVMMEYIALCASSFLKDALISERKSVTLCTGIEWSIILFDHFKDTHFLRYTENSMPSFIPSYKLSC